MAARDGSPFRTGRYRYDYDDAKFYEEPDKLTIEYNSDDERKRRRQRGVERGQAVHSQLLPVYGTSEKEGSDTHSYSRQSPSPPPLYRTQSTGSDRRPYRYVPRPPRNGHDELLEASQYLNPNRPRKYEYEARRSGTHSPAFALPPTPRIIVSEATNTSDPPLHPPWARRYPSGSITDTAPELNPSASSLGLDVVKSITHKGLGPLEFRLVRVFPKRMSAVKCEIISASLLDPPLYTAISYAWGDADDKRPIQIDDTNIYIAVSLHGALNAVRKQDEEIMVWADALCIDQQDKDERSEQVQLMAKIFKKATQVAIWLGPSENDSDLAKEFLQDIIITENNPKVVAALLLSPSRLQAVKAVVHLFQREYWKRLWIVQEVSNANSIKVYCGDTTGLPYGVYKRAAHIFRRHKKELDVYFSTKLAPRFQSDYLTYSRVLAYEGPNSLLDLGSVNRLGEESLLHVVRACRRKLTSEPRDRIFGVLGVLPEVVQKQFPANYNLSVKQIYTDVVDFLLSTTGRLDVICESIHYPKQTSVTSLPSWVPDWSQNPDITALGFTYDFAAANTTKAEYELEAPRNELGISAVYVDTVRRHGTAVTTLCTLADYLMAFLNWRAILLESMSHEKPEFHEEMEMAFCRTLCLGQVPPDYKPVEWMRKCYRVFATQFRNRLPLLPIDEDLRKYADSNEDSETNYRQFLQSHFGSRMMGRCFFLTKTNNDLGMGTGFMLPDDVIIVPYGCKTPIVIRKEGDKPGRFRFIGDVYLDGYMDGRAIRMLNAGEKDLQKFVLV